MTTLTRATSARVFSTSLGRDGSMSVSKCVLMVEAARVVMARLLSSTCPLLRTIPTLLEGKRKGACLEARSPRRPCF